MTTMMARVCAIAAAVSLVLLSATEVKGDENCETILQLLENTPSYSNLYKAINRSSPDIVSALGDSTREITLFAPNNAAFRALSAQTGIGVNNLIGKLSTAWTFSGVSENNGPRGVESRTINAWIQGHTIDGETLMLDDLADGDVLDTAWSAACCASDESGKSIPKQYTLDVKKPGRRITLETQSANATVIRNKSDVVACNGVIHEVETILPTLPLPLPDDGCESVYDYVKSRPEFSTLKKAIDETAKYRTLFKQQMQNPLASITILLPTNKAFEDFAKASGRSVNYLLTSDRKTLSAMLEYHVIAAPSTEPELNPLVGLQLPTGVSATYTTQESWSVDVNLNSAFGMENFCAAVLDAVGNTVDIMKQDQACASTIYVIEKLLLPCDAEA